MLLTSVPGPLDTAFGLWSKDAWRAQLFLRRDEPRWTWGGRPGIKKGRPGRDGPIRFAYGAAAQ